MLNNQGYKGVSLGIRKNDTKLKKEKELQNAIKANQANSTPAPNIVLPPPSQYVEDPGGTEDFKPRNIKSNSILGTTQNYNIRMKNTRFRKRV